MAGEKRLNISVDNELHKRLRIAAIASEITSAEYVRRAIKEKLEREEGKHK